MKKEKSAPPTAAAAGAPGAPKPPGTTEPPKNPHQIDNESLDASVCPVCKTDRYLNPMMRLRLSPCYHKLCESCIGRIFAVGPAPCPQCGAILRKSAFVLQTFEDIGVEKEVHIRQRIAKVFNKQLGDFDGDLARFNDYLEESEDLVFNLLHGIDVDATNARIEAYKAQNRLAIAANVQKQRSENKAAASRLEAAKLEQTARRDAYLQALSDEQRIKDAEKERLLKLLEHDSSHAARQLVADGLRQIGNVHISLDGGRATVNLGDGRRLKSQDAPLLNDEAALAAAKEQAAAADAALEPLDPFDNLYESLPTRADDPDAAYFDPVLAGAQADVRVTAGGWTASLAFERAIWSSHVGAGPLVHPA